MRELVSRAYASIVRKYESINMICSTYLCYIKAYLKNIDISKECRFYGCTSFNKGRSSVLKIGNNCQFRSSETSNNMGLNHRCIISSTNWNRGGNALMVN